MRHIDDPGQMTADQRFHEIAAILAGGLLRWKKRAKPATDSSKSAGIRQNPPKSGPGGLEVSGETRLSVRAG